MRELIGNESLVGSENSRRFRPFVIEIDFRNGTWRKLGNNVIERSRNRLDIAVEGADCNAFENRSRFRRKGEWGQLQQELQGFQLYGSVEGIGTRGQFTGRQEASESENWE